MMMRLKTDWWIAGDPRNEGREQRWFQRTADTAQPAPVPGIIQQVLPDYHGVAWYWCRFLLPAGRTRGERILLRFGAVDYLAEVWLNGHAVGGHEGGETPFELDVTRAALAGENLLAVRVVNPGNEPVDGLTLNTVPHRNKSVPHRCGNSYNYGGILLPVEVWRVPDVRVADVFAEPDPRTGEVRVTVTVQNDSGSAAHRGLAVSLAPQAGGEVVARDEARATCPPGASARRFRLDVPDPQLWSLENPYLYLLNVALGPHQRSVRIGFRDFRVRNGWFTLNGRRLFLKSTHTGNHFPIGQVVPLDPDLMRRDLLYAKACGYNCVRFIAGLAWPEQLDYCDEIGLMVYEENLAAWCLADSPDMKRRFDLSLREMILRDRNHPSVTIWGLLNETFDGPVFRHAAASLPLLHDLDRTRLVLLGSGRWDRQPRIGSVCNPGGAAWEHQWGIEEPGAPAVSNKWHPIAGGYFDRAGDAHVYPATPQTGDVNRFIRNLGRDTKPVFLSEYGIGSLFDVIGEDRKFAEMRHRTDVPDHAAIRLMAERFQADWKRWGFDGVYPFPEDMLRDSQRLHMRQRRLGFNLVRSNPRLCGFNLTGMLDHGLTGEGMWTFSREFKPGTADTLRDGWAPLRWCLFVEPMNAYAGRPVTLEAVLANEDVLPAGEYPVTFRVAGPHGVLWTRKVRLVIPAATRRDRPPLALPVLRTRVTLKGPPGECTFAARLERGGAPAGDRISFRLADPAPKTAAVSAMTWGLDRRVLTWLDAHDVKTRPFETRSRGGPDVVLVGVPQRSGREQWCDLLRRIARGGVAVFLDPLAFKCGDDRTFWLPLARKGERTRFHDWLYHKECVAKKHPVFEGLQAGGILDWDYYGQVIGHDFFSGQDVPDEVVCAAFATGYPCPGGYASGVMLGTYALGAGRFVLNTLRIVEELGHPAADRLFLNLVRYARTQTARRSRRTPADFDRRLEADIYPPGRRIQTKKLSQKSGAGRHSCLPPRLAAF